MFLQEIICLPRYYLVLALKQRIIPKRPLMTKHEKRYLLLGIILALPIIGYGIMHALVYIMPMQDGSTGEQYVGNQLFYALILTVFGLMVPWWMLKLAVRNAAVRDPEEGELELRNIGKDKEKVIPRK